MKAPDENNTEIVRFENWTLRVKAAKNPKRLLILIHGLKGDENSMWVFSHALPADDWIIAPRAPYPVDDGGYSWRPPEAENLDQPGISVLSSEIDKLLRLVDGYSLSTGVEASQFDVMGFSQGAAVASLLALLHPERVQKVGILAGFVPKQAEPLIKNQSLKGKSFLVVHGIHDEMVSIERARDSISLLEQAGAQVDFCEDETGHKVSASCLRAVRDFFAD